MTIKMRLDTDALRALIKDNPQVEIEIGEAVMNNIKADYLSSKVESKISQVLNSMTTNVGTWSKPDHVIKCPDLKQAIKSATNEIVNIQVKESVDKIISERVQKLVDAEYMRLRKEFREVMMSLITPEMAKDIIREKLF